MSSERKKQTMLNGALILAVSTVIVKLIGAADNDMGRPSSGIGFAFHGDPI